VIRKPRVVTFRLDQATWDFMRELVPYTKYRNASSFIREGIDLLLKREEEQPSGWTVGRSPGGSRTQLSVRASSDVLKTSTLRDARHHRG
jgi:Arc/MetJ-type ribon-helix-helix transcriptional regulator